MSSVPLCASCGGMNPGSQCTACRQALYCSRACQRAHWPVHKAPCQALAAAAATAAAATAAASPSMESILFSIYGSGPKDYVNLARSQLDLQEGLHNVEGVLCAKLRLAQDLQDTCRHAAVKEARALLLQVLATRRETDGLNSPATLDAAHALADNLGIMGEYESSLALHRDTLERRRTTLGEDSKDTRASLLNLFLALRRAGCMQEAIALGDDLLLLRLEDEVITESIRTLLHVTQAELAWSTLTLPEQLARLASAQAGRAMEDKEAEVMFTGFWGAVRDLQASGDFKGAVSAARGAVGSAALETRPAGEVWRAKACTALLEALLLERTPAALAEAETLAKAKLVETCETHYAHIQGEAVRLQAAALLLSNGSVEAAVEVARGMLKRAKALHSVALSARMSDGREQQLTVQSAIALGLTLRLLEDQAGALQVFKDALPACRLALGEAIQSGSAANIARAQRDLGLVLEQLGQTEEGG